MSSSGVQFCKWLSKHTDKQMLWKMEYQKKTNTRPCFYVLHAHNPALPLCLVLEVLDAFSHHRSRVLSIYPYALVASLLRILNANAKKRSRLQRGARAICLLSQQPIGRTPWPLWTCLHKIPSDQLEQGAIQCTRIYRRTSSSRGLRAKEKAQLKIELLNTTLFASRRMLRLTAPHQLHYPLPLRKLPVMVSLFAALEAAVLQYDQLELRDWGFEAAQAALMAPVRDVRFQEPAIRNAVNELEFVATPMDIGFQGRPKGKGVSDFRRR
ncbi:hypothetical protein BKA70DRAFT_1266835 [Coprinopsis sp. MPI-PUGE-AT-0042]|nr:hypothetical protein BKA70DRAFT_1266835 [Coprinopsis sp. MPI-PUGE-AT-0042]